MNELLNSLDWSPIARSEADPSLSHLPIATHEAVLDVGGVSLRVYQLDTGERIINADDLNELFSPFLPGQTETIPAASLTRAAVEQVHDQN